MQRSLNEDQEVSDGPVLLMHLAIEQLALKMFTESKPSYMKMLVSLRNLYLKDVNSPSPSLPYVIQTIIAPVRERVTSTQPVASQASGKDDGRYAQALNLNVIELEFEVNPKTEGAIGNQRLKCYTYGQLYVYANLEFAKRMVEFTSRVLKVQGRNYTSMVERAPARI